MKTSSNYFIEGDKFLISPFKELKKHDDYESSVGGMKLI